MPSDPEWLRAVAALRSPVSTLQAMIGLALETGPWVAGSIMVIARGPSLETSAYLDTRALGCDRRQDDLGEGPAHDTIRIGAVQTAADLTADRRWPRWSPTAIALGIHRTLSVRLFTDRTLGTLNLYSTKPGEIPDSSVRDAEVIAALASVLLAPILVESQLVSALSTRGMIGQAQGVLMQKYRIDSGTAFDVLRRISQQQNIRLAVIAEQIATGAMVPDFAMPPDRFASRGVARSSKQ